MKGSNSPAARFGFSEDHWKSLSTFDQALYLRIRPMRLSNYTVQNRIINIETTLQHLDRDAQLQGGKLDLCPDFQRGHVWTEEKQVAFIEAVVRGTAPMTIRFNSPAWDSRKEIDPNGGLNPYDVVCVDGLQRLTALRKFVAGELKIFGEFSVDDLNETSFSFRRLNANWTMEMFNIGSREELLQFYLDINSGGVVHTEDELERVSGLLADARACAPPTVAKKTGRRKPNARG